MSIGLKGDVVKTPCKGKDLLIIKVDSRTAFYACFTHVHDMVRMIGYDHDEENILILGLRREEIRGQYNELKCEWTKMVLNG